MSSGAERAALLPSEASCSAAQSGAGERGEVTPGQHLQAIHAAFFNGGGWVDAFEWSDYDDAGHARWEALAESIGRNIVGAAAAPELFEAARDAEALIGSFGDLDHDKPLEAGLAKLRAAIAKALPPQQRPGEGGPALTGDETNSGGCDE